jgi:hypothetical protein
VLPTGEKLIFPKVGRNRKIKKLLTNTKTLIKLLTPHQKIWMWLRTGGDAADLAARYASVLEQLRNAERKLIFR